MAHRRVPMLSRLLLVGVPASVPVSVPVSVLVSGLVSAVEVGRPGKAWAEEDGEDKDAPAPPESLRGPTSKKGAPSRSPASAAPPEMSAAEVEKMVYGTVGRSGPAIDVCNDAYVAEYPSATGQVSLTATVDRSGTVVSSRAETTLDGARNLRLCLEKVARSWRFPPLTKDRQTDDLTLTLHIAKGAKFKLKLPGEKDEPKTASEPGKREGFIRFLPESFLPGWNPDADSGGGTAGAGAEATNERARDDTGRGAGDETGQSSGEETGEGSEEPTDEASSNESGEASAEGAGE